MKRLFVIALVLMLLVPVLGFTEGSGERSSPKVNLADVDPSGVTITWWHQHSRAREEGLKKMIEDFNRTNEFGITVIAEYAGGYDDIYNKMVTGIAANSVPELVVAYQNQASGYQVSGALVDLAPYAKDRKWGLGDAEKDYFEGILAQDVNAQFDNQQIGFPPNRSLEVLYYNKTWLQKLGYSAPPASWDEFYEICKAATDKANDKFGYAIRTDASNVFSQVISRGGDIVKPKGAGYSFNTKEAMASMEFMQKLYQEGYAIKIAEQYGDQTDFGNGKIMFAMGSTSGLAYFGSAVSGSDSPFDWDVAPIPHTTAKPVMNMYGASISVCKTTPEKQLASWIFLKWFTEPEQQARWVEVANYFPVRKSTDAGLSDYFAKDPKYKSAYDILKTSITKGEPPYSGYDEVRDAMSAAFNAILDGADIEKTLIDLEEEANEIHEEASP